MSRIKTKNEREQVASWWNNNRQGATPNVDSRRISEVASKLRVSPDDSLGVRIEQFVRISGAKNNKQALQLVEIRFDEEITQENARRARSGEKPIQLANRVSEGLTWLRLYPTFTEEALNSFTEEALNSLAGVLKGTGEKRSRRGGKRRNRVPGNPSAGSDFEDQVEIRAREDYPPLMHIVNRHTRETDVAIGADFEITDLHGVVICHIEAKSTDLTLSPNEAKLMLLDKRNGIPYYIYSPRGILDATTVSWRPSGELVLNEKIVLDKPLKV